MNNNSSFKKAKPFFRKAARVGPAGISRAGTVNTFFVVISLLFAGCKNDAPVSEVHGIRVPQGFTIEPVVDSTLISYPMFASFDNRGRLFLCESTGETFSTEDHLKKPPYHIRLLEDKDGDGKFEKSTIFAD